VISPPSARANDGPNLIRRVSTGVAGLDAVLGGGIPELSFNLLAGGPGAGKTTLAQQIIFENASPDRPGVYFTVLGEPTIKLIRYQRQYDFFDPQRIGHDVHLLNVGAEAAGGDLDVVLARIVAEVERLTPGIVVVDSFGTLVPRGPRIDGSEAVRLEQFVQRLSLHLTTWETTSFLISDYPDAQHRHPVFTIADGIVSLSQVADGNSVVRKLQVTKVRGQAFMPGLHTFRITDSGLQVYPRIPEQQSVRRPPRPQRLGTGVPGMDEMLGGGIPAGDAVMLAGPAGSGKTTFATQFVAEGNRMGEPAVIAVFEEYPEAYLRRARGAGVDLEAMVRERKLKLIYLRPLDLSVDETLTAILGTVEEVGASRVVIDSVSGFEIALAPAFRDDFRESFYRLVGALTSLGVTVLMTNEVAFAGSTSDLSFTGERVSFVTDDIIIQRYVELDGQLRTVLAVVKMRGSAHSHDFREYHITAQGMVVGESLRAYRGILTGFPERRSSGRRATYVGLTPIESSVLDALVRIGDASAATLATRTGTAPADVTRALDRLVALNYVWRADDRDDETTYRAIARSDKR
jgi:circadian clock protein KaiC